MYPGHWSTVKPDSPALIHAATGEEVSWLELDNRSNQVANLLQARGLKPGDHVSILMENHLSFFEIAWGAYRSGLYITCINRYLTAEEAAYIIQDSGTQVLFTSSNLDITAELLELIPNCPHRFIRGASSDNLDGFEDYSTAVAEQATTPLAEQPAGDSMLYSSGTTGQPKGIKRPLSGLDVSQGIPGV